MTTTYRGNGSQPDIPLRRIGGHVAVQLGAGLGIASNGIEQCVCLSDDGGGDPTWGAGYCGFDDGIAVGDLGVLDHEGGEGEIEDDLKRGKDRKFVSIQDVWW
jgi:hypothetical protein